MSGFNKYTDEAATKAETFKRSEIMTRLQIAANNMKEWRGTAANINNMTADQKRLLGNHLINKYQDKMMDTLLDRVQALQAGHSIDHSMVQLLSQVGVEL